MSHPLAAERIQEQLDQIDIEGWDSPVGRELLDTAKRLIIKPQLQKLRLRGAVAAQAEATAWEEVWLALRRPTTRRSPNPAGMMWVAARRAIRGEINARHFACSPRKAWDHLAEARAMPGFDSETTGVLSLDLAHDQGVELADLASGPRDLGFRLRLIAAAMVRHGWDPEDAADVVAILADQVSVDQRTGSAMVPWRWVSIRLGIPEWRARRCAGLLIGSDGWPGLFEVIVSRGPQVLSDPAIDAAIRATTDRALPCTQAALSAWSREYQLGLPAPRASSDTDTAEAGLLAGLGTPA